jgi:quinol monooxygenase YgiN
MSIYQAVIVSCGAKGQDFYLKAASTQSHFKLGSNNPGCLANHLFKSADNQCMWHQEWRSQDDLNQHMTSKDTADHIKFVQENGMTFVLGSGSPTTEFSYKR